MSGALYPLDHGLGYAPLPRAARTLEPLMQDAHAFQLWGWLYLRARHEPGWAQGYHGTQWLEAGETMLGLRHAASELRANHKRIDRGLKKLERLGLIEQKRDGRGTVVRIVHYAAFGEEEERARDSEGDGRGTVAGQFGGRSRDSSGDVRNGETEKRRNGKRSKFPPSAVRAAAESVVGAFNRTMGRNLDPKRFTEPVRKALSKGYSEAEMRAAIWWASQRWNEEQQKTLDPTSLLKLTSPQGYRTLEQYVGVASELWREQNGGETPPWEADHARAEG